jgi:cation diffusion facilitator family transporter
LTFRGCDIELNPFKFYENPLFVTSFLLFINVILFVLKIIIGILSRSLALQADAYDCLTDIVMTLAALIGILYSNKKPNAKFPYGYYKIENIISLIISFFMFFTAYNIIIQSITDIVNFINGVPKIIFVTSLYILFLFIFLAISISLTFYLRLAAKKSRSSLLKSESDEKLYDNFISLSVLIGFIFSIFQVYLIDSIIGLIICLFIIKGGYDIFLNSAKTLLDAVIEFDKRKELFDLLQANPVIKNVSNLEVRSYGKYIFIEVTIILNRNITLTQIQSLKTNLSDKIKDQFPEIFKIIIITKSQEKQVIKIAVPLSSNADLNSLISPHFGDSEFFAILEFDHDDDKSFLLRYEIIKNKFLELEKRKGINIADWLVTHKIHRVYVKQQLNQGPDLIFKNSFVEVIKTDLNNLMNLIKLENDAKIPL